MNIKHFIKRKLRFLEFLKWTYRTMFRLHRGNWYIFRDCPDWFIRLICSTEDMDDRDDLYTYQKLAKSERAVRKLRRK